jgi:Ni/Fe-hydrogenase subunit HybB-like protein
MTAIDEQDRVSEGYAGDGDFDPGKAPVLAPGYTYASVTDKISSLVLTGRTPRGWFVGMAIAGAGVMLFLLAVTWLFVRGVGIWGINVPVMWGFAIVNFVWWVGIGHAGTLISAILLLLRQEWRTSINRFAEAMTLFAVACAGMFPLLHLGRPYLFYWLLPYPNVMALWPQWRSPLVWDVFAVSTYATVSLLFWYVGLIPDLATLRDRSRNVVSRVLYGMCALGWRGSAVHWQRYSSAYLLLAALATPLVVSVHTVVSFDFTIGIVPGWHSTIFPPYFVAGAILSGFAMVMTLAIPLRKFYGLEDFITERHLNAMALMMLATGSIVGYGYLTEVFMAWYGGNPFEEYVSANRAWGPYWWVWWGLMFCNIATVQTLWFKPIRRSIALLFVVATIVNTGMWLERYMIVVTSLHRDFLPSAWGMYTGTKWDWMTFVGTLGFFSFLFILFIRVLPVISIAEMRELVSVKEGPAEASDESVRPTPEDIPIPAAPAARFEPVGEPGHFEEAEHPRPPGAPPAYPVGEPPPPELPGPGESEADR